MRIEAGYISRKSLSRFFWGHRPKAPIVVALSVVLSLISVATAVSQDQRRPLVFVPGIIGSVLVESGENGEAVWGSVRSLFKRNFTKLDLLPPYGPPVDLVAHDILRGFPLLFGALSVGGYGGFIQFLVDELGYREGIDLHVFSYDWRRTNFASAHLLSRFIDDKVGGKPYDLIAHSMGGIVTRLMLGGAESGGICERGHSDRAGLSDLRPEDLEVLCNAMYGPIYATTNRHEYEGARWPSTRFIGPYGAAYNLHTYIEVAVPHYGTNEVIAVFDDTEWGGLARILPPLKLKSVLTSFPSLIELAPTYENCCAHGRDGAHSNVVLSSGDLLGVSWWQNVVTRLGVAPCTDRACELRRHLLAASLESREAIREHISRPMRSTVSYLAVFYGTEVGTRTTYYVDRQTSRITYKTTPDGDGRVASASSDAPEESARAHAMAFPKTSHASIFNSELLRAQLKHVILDHPEKLDREASQDVLSVAGAVVSGTSAVLAPRIAFSGEDVTLRLSITAAGRSEFDPIDVQYETFSASVTRADTGMQITTVPLTIHNDSFPEVGSLILAGKFTAPGSPHVYVVETFKARDGDTQQINDAILYIIKEE